jgi:hypothetical protein
MKKIKGKKSVGDPKSPVDYARYEVGLYPEMADGHFVPGATAKQPRNVCNRSRLYEYQ